MQRYKGEKKQLMPSNYSLINVLLLKLLCDQEISFYRSKECDLDFLGATLTSNKIPDFNGYITSDARMAGQSTKLETNIAYQPLID